MLAPGHQDLPAVVYHYTSLEGLLGIVQSRSIWATAVSYLNDSSERDCVVSAVTDRLTSTNPDDEIIRSLREHNGESRSDYKYEITNFAREQFVCSFSRTGDSLSHWRGYCPQQSGVAIGFKTAALRQARTETTRNHYDSDKSVFFGKVRYLNRDNMSEIDDIIATTKRVAERQSQQRTQTLKHALRDSLMLRACTYKDYSFSSEDEFRLLLGSLMFRERD